jgi:pimeloyl-ACP methyl ester carboxylesterase
MELIRVDPPGCDISLVRRAPAGGERARGCILFLHGLGDASSMFAPALEDPAFAPFELALVDLLGHGTSDKPLNFDYSPASHAAVLFSLAQKAGLSRPLHVVGFSFGGAVAVELSRFEPLGVSSLVLCEPALDEDRMSFASLVVARPEGDFADDYAELLASFATPEASEADRRWAETAAFASARSIWRCSMGALEAGRRGELVAHLEAHVGPKALILSHDTMDKWVRAHQLAAHGARLYPVSSPSKMPMYDAPEAFYRAVAQAVSVART